MEEKTQMSGTAVHRYELEYQKLADLTTSSFEVRSATEFFIEYPQERERAGEWSVLRAIGDQALRHEPLVVEKAVWALAHLEAWEQLGSLASAVIASAEQLDWRFRSSFDRFRGKDREPSPLWTLERALVKCLAKPINTDPLWPALQPYFRLKDQEIRRRAIDLVGQLHVGAAYRTLRNIVENPAQAPLHDSAVRAIGLIDSSPAVRYLLQLLANPTRQALGVCGAAYSKSPKLVPALEKLITNSSPATQIDAIYALGDIGGDSAARMLLKHLDGPHRWRVIDTLGTARSGVAVPRLSELLRSRDLRKQERDAVAEALSQIDTPEARQVLATTLARGRKKAASSAGSALSARRQY